MGLFGRRKPKNFVKSTNRSLEIKKKRRVFGRTSIAQTASPYTGGNMFGKPGKRRKRIRTASPSRLATPPARLSSGKLSKLKKIIIALLIMFIMGGMFYFVFFTDYFTVNEYHIYEEGTEITSNLKINDIVTQNLKAQNLLLFNATALIENILKDNPEYKSVTFTKILPRTIELELEKYPVAANIIDIIDGADGMRIQKKYLVNTNGMIIMENEENPDLPYIEVTTQNALEINAFPLNQEKLDYIIKLVSLFEEKFGIRVIEAVYLKSAREVHLRTEKGFNVWFDLGKDMLLQIDKLKRALPKLDIYKTPLLYIDLRISGSNAEKVIFKRR